MFGGKKLKDLTEEDIRKYAASLASANRAPPAPAPAPGGPPEAPGDQRASSGPEQPPPPGPPPPEAQQLGAGEAASAGGDRRRLAEAIVEQSAVRPEEEEAADRLPVVPVGEPEAVKVSSAVDASQVAEALTEEERLRLEVLSELERSQMPAVRKDDGALVKTIEHYTFADSLEVATLYIDLDKDLFEGAAAFVSEEQVEVTTRESDVTILLRGLPAAKGVSALADWRLHLAPLFHGVVPSDTTWKVRKGKVAVRLRKKKPQEWRRVLKF